MTVSELIKKTPKLTNIWSAATIPPASQPAAAATSFTSSQPEPVPFLAVQALLTQFMMFQSQVLVHNDMCAEMKCMAPLNVK